MRTTVRNIKVRYDTIRRVCSIRRQQGDGGGLETLDLDGGGGFQIGGWVVIF